MRVKQKFEHEASPDRLTPPVEASASGVIPTCIMEFRPTIEEFQNFPSYIFHMEAMGAHRAGIAKVIPPPEWVARKNGYDDLDIMIPLPIQQHYIGKMGVYQLINVEQKPMHVKEYQKVANSSKYLNTCQESPDNSEELDRRYRANLTFNPPIYGADCPGTLMDLDQTIWNTNNLGTILDLVKKHWQTSDNELKHMGNGVTTPFLYFGMWKSSFAWHTEDMDLYSINYHHFGAPKVWYAVPLDHSGRLERLADNYYPQSAKTCSAFLRHKMTVIMPHVCRENSIQVNRVVQHAGEFIVTFPRGYHSGFNVGYNCAESTNFASERWIDFGKSATICACSADNVRIDMDIFVQEFQSDKFEEWLLSKKRKMILSQRYALKSGGLVPSHRMLPSKPLTTDENLSYQYLLKPSPHRAKRRRIPALRKQSNLIHGSSSDSEVSTSDYDNSIPCKAMKRMVQSPKSLAIHGLIKAAASVNGRCSKSIDGDLSYSTLGFSPSPPNSLVIDPDIPSTSHKFETEHVVESLVCTTVCLPGYRPLNAKFDSDLSDVYCMGDWSKPLDELWQFKMYDMKKEKKYNADRAMIEPHCWLCQFFVPRSLTKRQDVIPPCSRRILSDARFVFPDENEKLNGNCCAKCEETEGHNSCSSHQNITHPDQDDVKEDILLQCSGCSLCIHRSCYGETNNFSSNNGGAIDWKCSRCVIQDHFAECTLCCLRGGALQQTDDGRWAHLICAFMIKDIYFDSPPAKRPVIIPACVQPNEKENEKNNRICYYCRNPQGVCIQCCFNGCDRLFHITCGYEAGVSFEQRDWPCRSAAVCTRHNHPAVGHSSLIDPADFKQLSRGDKVLAQRTDNSNFEPVEILDIGVETFCVVDFIDGTFSNNIYPSDIEDCDCHNCNHAHIPGAAVWVRWTDGELYKALFRRAYSAPTFKVRFPDGFELACSRNDLFADGEPIPQQKKKRSPRKSGKSDSSASERE